MSVHKLETFKPGLCSSRANCLRNAESAEHQWITAWKLLVARRSKFRGFEKQTIVLPAPRTTQGFMSPAFGGTLGSFEVQQESGEVRDERAVDFGRLPVAFFGHGHLPGDRLVSGPKAVCSKKSKTCFHSSRNAPGRFQPSPKFFSPPRSSSGFYTGRPPWKGFARRVKTRAAAAWTLRAAW